MPFYKLLIAFLFLLVATPAFSQNHRFEISASRTRFDVERSQDRKKVRHEGDKVVQSNTMTMESVGYKVRVTNKGFQEVSDIEVQYRIFKREGVVGLDNKKVPMTAVPGSKTVPSLKQGASTTFETEAVTLKSKQLDPDWHYKDGSKNKTEDSLEGIWVKVLKQGQVVAEYANPAALARTEAW